MNKLRLNLDQLAVESFETDNPRSLRGTVRGNAVTIQGCVVTDEYITCGSCPNAGGTCDEQCGTGYTCGSTCGGTCNCSGDTCASTCPLPGGGTCAQNAC